LEKEGGSSIWSLGRAQGIIEINCRLDDISTYHIYSAGLDRSGKASERLFLYAALNTAPVARSTATGTRRIGTHPAMSSPRRGVYPECDDVV
jgi:hypothetical protein